MTSLVVKVVMPMVFLFKRVPDRGPEQRESNLTVLYQHIIIILIGYIIIKLLTMENHSSRNRKWNSRPMVVKEMMLLCKKRKYH
jgi:hypothetical protein